MQKNGEAIYGTTASPFKRLLWGRATQKPDKLYLHIFYWPSDGELVVPIRGNATKAYLLSAPNQPLKIVASTSNQGLHVKLPANAPDPIASVLVLEGVGKVDPLPPPPIQQTAEGTLQLGCDAADLVGKGLRVEGNTQLNLAGWNSADAYPQWDVQIDKPGSYEVTANMFVPEAQAGSEYEFALGDQKLSLKTVSAGTDYKPVKLGTIHIVKTGPTTITMKVTKLANKEVMRFRSVTLTPAAR